MATPLTYTQDMIDALMLTLSDPVKMPIFPQFPRFIGLDIASRRDETAFHFTGTARYAAGGRFDAMHINGDMRYGKFNSEFVIPLKRHRLASPDVATMRDDIRRAEETYARDTMINLVDMVTTYTITEKRIEL